MVVRMASESYKLDKLLWGLVLIILVSAVLGNYYFAGVSLLLRVVALVVCASVAIAVALKTAFGQKAWVLALESAQEVRRMYWPTRQETVHTTLAVLAMVCVMGILLWIADTVLLRAVKLVMTGHWGV